MDINKLVRENIRNLKPYSSARDEYKDKEGVFLDANENPFNTSYNRYPDPLQVDLKKRIAGIKHIEVENIFLGNGSDEAIDLLIRIFCRPGLDNILSIDPSYGMYEVCASINDIEFRKVTLTQEYQLDLNQIMNAIDDQSKILFLCSPNNPTANSLNNNVIKIVLEKFKGIVVVDEAYIDFSGQASLLPLITEFNNLVILQTFSKAWGLAGIRLGMALSNRDIINYMNKVKYPYNVNVITQQKALEYLNEADKIEEWVSLVKNEREKLSKKLEKFDFVKQIFPSDANFLLVKVDDPLKLYNYLLGEKIIVRDRSKVHLCQGALRVTVGTPGENDLLMEALGKYNGEI